MQRFLAEVKDACLNVVGVILAIALLSFPISLFIVLYWLCWLIGGTPHAIPDTY